MAAGQRRNDEQTGPGGSVAAVAGGQRGADDVQAACAAARAAFYPWSHRPLAERIAVVERFAALLETHKEALATLISRETSKPLWETRTEVQAMIGKAAISIEAYHQRTGFHESTLPDGKAQLRHKPHGVMAVFGPYNFPGHLPNGHIIPALIAGNTIVFKPSELTPATAEMTVQLWQQAGVPDGVINLLQGGKATGQALLENRDIDGVLFTGSAAAGFHFHRYFGGQPEKMLALEMGGNNALIVADVADVDAALNVIIQSAFISAGQRCTCARRLIVPRGEQGDALLQRRGRKPARRSAPASGMTSRRVYGRGDFSRRRAEHAGGATKTGGARRQGAAAHAPAGSALHGADAGDRRRHRDRGAG